MTSFNLFANSVSIINNGQVSYIREVILPFSNLIMGFISILKDEGYIESFFTKEKNNKQLVICVELKYYDNVGVISDMLVISKPSRRVYWSVKKFKKFYNGLGMFILSTSSGVLPMYKAVKMNLGGEVLCGVF